MYFDEDTVIMTICFSIIALVWIKYFATYFIKQHAKRIKERKLDKIRKEIAEAGQYPGTVITIPPINIASGKALKQGYDNKVKVTDEDDIEPTYIVIKLKD